MDPSGSLACVGLETPPDSHTTPRQALAHPVHHAVAHRMTCRQMHAVARGTAAAVRRFLQRACTTTRNREPSGLEGPTQCQISTEQSSPSICCGPADGIRLFAC